MEYTVSYKGKRLQLSVSGSKGSTKDIRSLLEAVALIEQQVSEADLRTKVVKQLKAEIMSDADVDDVQSPGWWDVPVDLIKHKDAGPFLTMEADLNQSVVFEKASFSLKTVFTESGQQYVFDRDQLKLSLQKLSLQDKFKLTKAVLVRVKGTAVKGLQSEIEDFLRSYFPVDRVKIVFEAKKYGDRASLEFVLFGDFLLD